ncbi:hypothetical protein AYI68_g2016 [Smittium mucronatum]|uniref:Uncharacterized protein n=1 Tax=Smittium mucronatum TaxID=133383 RepID=A0A1R0H421_9FUNG|nr:hypothetical protein AYI68_g2016 [Smittium mucronatum]
MAKSRRKIDWDGEVDDSLSLILNPCSDSLDYIEFGVAAYASFVSPIITRSSRLRKGLFHPSERCRSPGPAFFFSVGGFEFRNSGFLKVILNPPDTMF